MSKFHRTVPYYTDQQWTALKHRNGYSAKPIVPPSASSTETALPAAVPEVPLETLPETTSPPVAPSIP